MSDRPTCGTCMYWQAPRSVSDGSYGACEAVPFFMTEDFEDLRERGEVPALVEDGSGYYGALVCRDDFGCVLHRPRPLTPPAAPPASSADRA